MTAPSFLFILLVIILCHFVLVILGNFVFVILSNFVLENVGGQSAQGKDSSTVPLALETLSKAVESLEAKIESQTIALSNFETKVEIQINNVEDLLRKMEGNVEIQATPLKKLATEEVRHEPIAHSPANRTIVAFEGDDVDLWCVVHGIPLPEIRWTRENGSLESNRVVVENNGKVLRIKSVQLNDEGSYVCVAANGVGTPATQSIRLQVYGKYQQCNGMIESDKGILEIEPSSVSCLTVIKLQNTTGFRLQLDPLMTEPILVIPEQSPSNSDVQFIRIYGSKNVSKEFEGKSLGIVMPSSGRERWTLNWTGLSPDDSGAASSTNFAKYLDAKFEWESMGIGKIFWAFDHVLSGELTWTLNTALAASDQKKQCENISFSILEIKPDGNISEIQRTCDGSSDGSVTLETSSEVLVRLHSKSVKAAGSKLGVTWTHHDELLEKNVDGIVAGTYDGVFVITLNSTQAQRVAPGDVLGVTFDWNSQKIYYLKDEVGLIRSKLDGSESQVLVSEPSSILRGLTIEPTSGNFYYADNLRSTITVCNNDAKKCSTIANGWDVAGVYDLAVHRSKGLLFWSIEGSRVVRANLDGSNATVVLRGYHVVGIDVNEHANRLYWGHLGRDGYVAIGRCDLDGQYIQMLPSVNRSVTDVAVDNDRVYYVDRYENGIHVISKTGKNQRFVAEFTQPRAFVRHITLAGTQVSNQPANPCQKSKCTHLCVLVTRWSYRCMGPENPKRNVDRNNPFSD